MKGTVDNDGDFVYDIGATGILKLANEASIMKRAIDKGLVEVHIHNLRDYTTNKQKSVDDFPFGGGAGMVMTIQPIDGFFIWHLLVCSKNNPL